MISILSTTRMDGLDKWKRLRLSGWLTPFFNSGSTKTYITNGHLRIVCVNYLSC